MRRTPPLSPEAALAVAWVELDAAAAVTAAAYEATWHARTLAAEDKAYATWNKAHEAQNRAAERLHAANRALGRAPCDDRR